MPFNRDLIETGCVLKTFDGDLSLLERAIDVTLKKSPISPPKDETVTVAPLSINFSTDAASLPKEKRHIKDVVHGDHSEMPSTSVQEVQAVNHSIAKQVVEVPAAASGFCFRHIVEDTETITSTLQSVCTSPASQPVIPAATQQAITPAQPAIRASRSVKDVVYGDMDVDGQCGQSNQIKAEQKKEQPKVPVTHFKSCMRGELPADAAPHVRIAVKALVSEVSHHTHWRSAIHGF